MSDSTKMKALAEKLNAMVPLARSRTGLIGYEKTRRKIPLVRLDEFFDGNDEERSLIRGSNHTPLAKVRMVLREVERCPDVFSVRIAVTEYAEPTETRRWPYSERVLIVATLSRDRIVQLFRPLKPSAIGVAREDSYFGVPQIGGGATLYEIRWGE